MLVGEFCCREVVIIDPQASVTEAAKLMRRHHVGDVVVAASRDGDQFPVGILTDRDIVVRLLAEGVNPAGAAASEVMSSDLLTARENDDILDTIKRMRSRGVRRVPVVDQRGVLAGILTVDDLIDLVAEQLSDLVKLITRERKREQEAPS